MLRLSQTTYTAPLGYCFATRSRKATSAGPVRRLTTQLIRERLLRPHGREAQLGRPLARELHQFALRRHWNARWTSSPIRIRQRLNAWRREPPVSPLGHPPNTHAQLPAHLDGAQPAPERDDRLGTLNQNVGRLCASREPAHLQPLLAVHRQIRFHRRREQPTRSRIP